jgi:hypothetical protein
MVRAFPTRRSGEPEASAAGAAPRSQANGDVAPDLCNGRSADRPRTSGVMRNSERRKGLGKLTLVPIDLDALSPDPSNPRKHSRIQIRAIARSIDWPTSTAGLSPVMDAMKQPSF